MHPKSAPKTLAPIFLSIVVLSSACATSDSRSSGFCGNNQAACLAIGAVIVGGIIASNSGGGATTAPPLVSDERLKTEVTPLYSLDNGLKIYAYRYIGTDAYFAGVMAQDLLSDQRFAHAVSISSDGFYTVDYSLLPVRLLNSDAMFRAGENALEQL